MRAAKWYNNKDIRIEEMPIPRPGEGEILLKVISCGICGSDVVEWYRLPRAPLVLGHEIGAQVIETGAAVRGYISGDRVFVAPKAPCMTCRYCKTAHYPVCTAVKERLPGGFAECICVPRSLVENGMYKLPDTISYDQSTFIEPLACVVRAQNLAGVKPNQTVLVMGCGTSGLLQIKLAKAKGCRVLAADINNRRLALAEELGADIIFHPAEDNLQAFPAGTDAKADVVMICTSAVPAVTQSWRYVDKGGVIIFFAVPGPDIPVRIPITDLWADEIQIRTSYYCGPPDILESINLLDTGRLTVDELITHRLPLEEIAKGFRLVMDGTESVKVIIRPNE